MILRIFLSFESSANHTTHHMSRMVKVWVGDPSRILASVWWVSFWGGYSLAGMGLIVGDRSVG